MEESGDKYTHIRSDPVTYHGDKHTYQSLNHDLPAGMQMAFQKRHDRGKDTTGTTRAMTSIGRSGFVPKRDDHFNQSR